VTGERVRLARQYLGLTQAELARIARVSQSAISQIENGGEASEHTLRAICKGTGYGLRFFERGFVPDVSALSLRYRKRASSRRIDQKRLRAHFLHGVELIRDIENSIQLNPVTLESVGKDVDYEDIETLAVFVRQKLGVNRGDPIPNVTRAAERAGAVVFGDSGEPEAFSAVSAWPRYPAGRPLICFNRNSPGERQRLSIAHEIGHLVLHQMRIVDPKRAEKEAFRFGTALLFPKREVANAIRATSTLRDFGLLKAKWGVSIAALIRRGFDLKILDQNRYRSLMMQLSARGWRKREPVRVPAEEPVLLLRALRLAYGTDRAADVAARIGITPIAAKDLIA
jgi:Zn-dependent peptidase ImmA (M78 family)/transcriptional regulator with XRE-family HTH domain